MTAGPERFADIVHRHFPRLKEPTVNPPQEPRSAEDHYLLGEKLLACADVASAAHDFARVHELSTRARTHYTAALAAMAIWPAEADDTIGALTVALARAQAELDRWVRGYAEAEKYFERVCRPHADSPAPDGDLDVRIGAGAYRARIRTARLEPQDLG